MQKYPAGFPNGIAPLDSNSYIPDINIPNYGRYQSDYGFENATLSNLTLTSGVLAITAGQTTGTATKIVTPTDIDKWGNLKVTCADDDSSNLATVTIKDIAHNVLIAAVTLINGINFIDLSTIVTGTYPTLEVVYTLVRDSTGDATPLLSSTSVVWEGDFVGWRDIVEVDITPEAAQLDIIIPSGYKALELSFLDILVGTGSASFFRLRFNSDSGNNYNNSIGFMNVGGGSTSTTVSVSGDFRIQNIASQIKTCLGFVVHGSTGSIEEDRGGIWKNSSDEINTISLYLDAGTLGSGKVIVRGYK